MGPTCNSVGPIWLGFGHNVISVRPITQTRWDQFALFGGTEMLRKGNREFTLQSWWDRSLISVRPKSYGGKQGDYNPISVRPRSLSVRPICLGFVAVAMTFELGGVGYKVSVGPSFTFGLGQMWM